MLSITEGAVVINTIVRLALENDTGALIGRNGSTELELIIDVDASHLYDCLRHNAGVFPITHREHLIKWRYAAVDAIRNSDVLVSGWYLPLVDSEQALLRTIGFNGPQIPLRSLEPYYVEPEYQWTQLLSGHRVAVVSSFTQTMQTQIEKKDAIWLNKIVLSNTIDWSWVQTGYSPDIAKGKNEWPPGIHSWSEAVDYVVSSVIAEGARFALIGCGGLGMPIAKALKDRGVIAIVLGGAIQVLFGIKGRRWQNHDIISNYWNDAWVYPSKEEIPSNARIIEGGCYW
jgi:hypothetical protein